MKTFPEPWRLWRFLANGGRDSSMWVIEDADMKEIAHVEFPGSGLISEQQAKETAEMLCSGHQLTPWVEPPMRSSRHRTRP